MLLKIKFNLPFVILLLLIASCKVSHNIPSTPAPNSNVSSELVEVFVDQNGNFFPDQWEKIYGPPNKKGAYSLTTIANKKNIIDSLINYENKKLSEIKSLLDSKQRIYILVHGFNSSDLVSKKSFNLIKQKLNINSTYEIVLNFYWDGLVANDPIGSAKIWFNAAGYSQLAGEYGLRRILNLLNKKEIIIISHSRGASVVLSALSTPPYVPQFAADTKKFHNVCVINNTKLEENNNIIRCIMLAPAIGLIDFKKDNYYYTWKKDFRKFTSQLKSIFITINNDDPVLKKFISGLSAKLNPTNLGYKIGPYNELVNHYNFFKSYSFTGMNKHDFTEYVNNPKFDEMLINLKLK